MQSNHSEYIRISENKKTACLMVHGIVGSPRYFDRIIPLLPESWSVYNILLEGHGGTVKDFSEASMEQWKKQVREALTALQKEYKEIYVFAHSMGTLLTMDAVINNPEKVKKMFLFAIPMSPRVEAGTFVTSAKTALRLGKISKETYIAKRQYSISPDRKVWRYLGYVPRYLELLDYVGEMRDKINLLKVNSVAFISGQDEMVSPISEKYIKRNKNIEICYLFASTHNYFFDDDFNIVKEKIKELTL